MKPFKHAQSRRISRGARQSVQFFGKLKGKVDTAFTDASQKLRESVDQVVSGAGEKLQESRLANELKTFGREREAKIRALGEMVLNMHRDGGVQVDKLALYLSALDTLEQKISAKQDEIDLHASGVHTFEPTDSEPQISETPAEN